MRKPCASKRLAALTAVPTAEQQGSRAHRAWGAAPPHSPRSSAGSATLVLQTVLPALLQADGPSTVALGGGTHNPFAPPFPFLERAFLPLLQRAGAGVEVTLERPGFYPAGGGRFTAEIRPAGALRPFELLERGEPVSRRARALVAELPRSIGERELQVVTRELGWAAGDCAVEEVRGSAGPGNLLSLELEYEHVTEVCTGFGQRGRPASAVGEEAVAAAQRYLARGAPVGEHLADQLLVPLALAGGGAFATGPPTRHTRTNAEVIERFLPVRIEFREDGGVWRVTVRPA